MKPYCEIKKPIERSLFPGPFAKKYGECGAVKLSNKTIIKTVSYSQTEIIQWVMALYCPDGFELDPTYSAGNFYKNIVEPTYKFDLLPQSDSVVQADAENLPVRSAIINSVMFDPPFVAGIARNGKPGIIRTRFGSYRTVLDLWKMYRGAISEIYRILKNDGVLVFKCQDTIDASKQYMTHVWVMNYAFSIGFYPKDLFILLARDRIIGPKSHKQQHARKFHSYFWVFIKKQSFVNYDLNG